MHFNLADFVIVVLCVGALLRGYQIGFIRQMSSTVAFLVGLYPGTLLSSLAMDHMNGPTRPIAGLAILLAVCFTLMTIGELIAVRLKFAVKNRLAQKIDDSTGAVMSVVTFLLGMWLASALFALAPPSGVQTQLKNSVIVSNLTSRLPPAASVLSTLNKLIDPNQAPQVFTGREPSPNANYKLPDAAAHNGMLNRVQTSVVKVEGLGCGGIVDGSGFVFAPGYVATNAHVVAGVLSPKIRSGTQTYNTTVVLFDAANDLAVLYAPSFDAAPLAMNRTNAAAGTPAFALGYPGGGEYTVSPAAVLDRFDALGQDIYGQKRSVREVYALQTTVVRGNSGGPVVTTDGSVIGVVFATSTTYNNVGYALTMEQVYKQLKAAETRTSAVGSGQCSE